MSSEEAEKDFQQRTRIHQSVDQAVGGNGWIAEDRNNTSLGQNILREEIGYFGTWDGARYNLDQETRDRLLAHIRQDVASSFAMARSAFREAHQARRVAVRAVLFLILSIVLNIAILATLWIR